MPYKDPDKRRASGRKNAAKWRNLHRDQAVDANRRCRLKKSYGIDDVEYANMLVSQNGVCAICRRPERVIMHGKMKRLSVDHCHDTGNVRALLCTSCNNGIGRFEHDPARLRAAADYIERTK